MKEIKKKEVALLILGSAILAFGYYNVHSIADVTEGGALGLTLLLQHWFHISPAISAFFINFACFFLGWRLLGGKFIIYSFIPPPTLMVIICFWKTKNNIKIGIMLMLIAANSCG